MEPQADSTDQAAVNRAFSKQSGGYDEDDRRNPVLKRMREQVYRHVAHYIHPADSILELNAGTGIDAAYFASKGHRVLATDLSNGMIAVINNKIAGPPAIENLSVRQLSYDQLDALSGNKFDYIFSNFGGLNCIDDLSRVTRFFPAILNSGGGVTLVIMPPIYFWEWLGLLRGRFSTAFRRINNSGIKAHLEGEYFMTWYHSVREIRKAFGDQFELVKAEGLCVVTPPPHRGDFPGKFPVIDKLLSVIDSVLRNIWPFNRTGDHVIITFRKR